MASIWKLPVLFVCENNQFATEVPFAYASGNPERRRAAGRRMACPAFEVDGNDVLAVSSGRRRGHRPRACRRGADADRMQDLSHAARTPKGWATSRYRTREEVEEWKQRCPIARLRRAARSATEAAQQTELDADRCRGRATLVREARQFAEDSPVARRRLRRRDTSMRAAATPAARASATPGTQCDRAADHLHAGHARSAGRRDGRATRGSS